MFTTQHIRKQLAVTDGLKQWFASYLTQCSIRVKVDDNISPTHELKCGVPQGSHLAPLLFALFINTLPEVVSYSHVYMYADDVVLLRPHQPGLPDVVNTDDLQQALKARQEWAQSVYGNFSPKTTMITTLPSPHPFQCIISRSVKSEVRHLGILLNAELNFSNHFKYLKKYSRNG